MMPRVQARHAQSLGGMNAAVGVNVADGVNLARRSTGEMGRGRHGRMVTLIGLAVTCLVAGLVTWAWWGGAASQPGATIQAGDLELVTRSESWREAAPGTPVDQLVPIAPSDIHLQPGDIVEIVYPISVKLLGDNLRAAVDVSPVAGAAADSRLVVGFHVEDSTGHKVAPADGESALDRQLTVPGMVGNNRGESSDWNVVIRLVMKADYDWTDGPTPAASPTISPGDFHVNLLQVRDGVGDQGQS